MIQLDQCFVGALVRLDVDPRPALGHVTKVGRKYIHVMVCEHGQTRMCLPAELDWP